MCAAKPCFVPDPVSIQGQSSFLVLDKPEIAFKRMRAKAINVMNGFGSCHPP